MGRAGAPATGCARRSPASQRLDQAARRVRAHHQPLRAAAAGRVPARAGQVAQLPAEGRASCPCGGRCAARRGRGGTPTAPASAAARRRPGGGARARRPPRRPPGPPAACRRMQPLLLVAVDRARTRRSVPIRSSALRRTAMLALHTNRVSRSSGAEVQRRDGRRPRARRRGAPAPRGWPGSARPAPPPSRGGPRPPPARPAIQRARARRRRRAPPGRIPPPQCLCCARRWGPATGHACARRAPARCATAGVASDEPSSTTITSNGASSCCSLSEASVTVR